MEKVTHPNPKLSMDQVLLKKIKKSTTVSDHLDHQEEKGKMLNLQFTTRGMMPVVNSAERAHVQEINDDLIRLIRNSDDDEKTKSISNIWGEEKESDSSQIEAKQILQFDDTYQTHFKHSEMTSAEDPILRAHAQLSVKARSKRIKTNAVLQVPMRYLRHKNIKVLFDFQRLLNEDEEIPMISHEKEKVGQMESFGGQLRVFGSTASTLAPKTEIVIDDDPFDAALGGDMKANEVRITDIDFLGKTQLLIVR
jgi:hypothetical protein